jgi:hypothetical protein
VEKKRPAVEEVYVIVLVVVVEGRQSREGESQGVKKGENSPA